VILTHTPLWAYLLLAYLVWQGILARRPRNQSIWRLMIVPAVFIITGLSRIALGGEDDLQEQCGGWGIVLTTRFSPCNTTVSSAPSPQRRG
jgi:hypothetical protein